MSKNGQNSRNFARKHLMDLIQQGEFSETGVLPSEQKLADMLGISRTPLRLVIDELINQDIITRNGKRGCVLRGKGMKLSSPMSDAIVFIADYARKKPGKASQLPGTVQPGISNKALENGYNLMVIQDVQTLATKGSINWFLGNHPLAVMPSQYIAHHEENVPSLTALQEAGINVIVSGNAPFMSQFHRVATDQTKGAYLLTQHLLERGLKDIRILDFGNPSYWMLERNEGYKKAMSEAGLKPKGFFPGIDLPEEFVKPNENNIEDYTRWLVGALAPEILSDKQPEAIMVYSDAYCPIIGKALDTLCNGEKRPVIAGFDGYWDEYETDENEKYCPVASIDTHPSRQGEMMVEMLQDILDRKITEPEVRFCKPDLQILKQ